MEDYSHLTPPPCYASVICIGKYLFCRCFQYKWFDDSWLGEFYFNKWISKQDQIKSYDIIKRKLLG